MSASSIHLIVTMPPKKVKTKATGVVRNRSAAQKETSLNYEIDENYETTKSVEQIDGSHIPVSEVVSDREETIEEKENRAADEVKNGVFSYYTALVDIYINTRHVFQLFMTFFLTNLLYLVFKGRQDKGDERALEPLITASCILLAVLLEGLAVLNSRFKQFQIGKTTTKPQLLEFDYIYAVFFPLAVCLIRDPTKIIIVACCIVQLSYMNIIVRVLISYVILFQFSEEQLSGQLLFLPLTSCFFYEMINKVSGSELPTYEKSFISFLITAMSYFVNADESDLTLFVMKNLVLSFIIGTILAYPVLQLYKSQNDKSLKYTWLLAIYTLFLAAGLIISDKLLLPVLGKFHLNWLIEFIKESEVRKQIFQNWCISALIIVPGVFIVFNKILPNGSLSLKRKIWHFILFGMMLKPMMIEPQLASVALFGILGLLVAVEMIRANELPPFGSSLKKLFAAFEDRKDTDGMFTLSYIYLMIGVSLPFWINNVNGSKESSYIGLITLGLGDSIASLVGSKFGKTKWPGSNKSFEGSIAMALSILGGYAIFDFVGASASVSTMETLSWTNRIMAAILCSAFEGIIDVNDNLFVPIFGYLIEELLFQFE